MRAAVFHNVVFAMIVDAHVGRAYIVIFALAVFHATIFNRRVATSVVVST